MALYVSGSNTQFGGALDGNRFDNNNLINYFTTLFRNYCRGLSTREIKIAIIVNSRTVRLSSGRGDINRSRVPYRSGLWWAVLRTSTPQFPVHTRDGDRLYLWVWIGETSVVVIGHGISEKKDNEKIRCALSSSYMIS